MKYTFNRHDPIPGSMVFVLILDMKRKKERILIGNENYIELRLRGSEEDNIFYDRTAPLGTLLMNFHQDLGRAWNEFGFMPFWDALHSNRWKQPELEKMGFDFLRSRFENGYPLDIYAALRISEGYLKARLLRDRNRAADIFNIEMAEIKDGLMDWTDERIKTPKKFYEDSTLSKKAIKIALWYPTGTPEPECVIAHDLNTRLSMQGERNPIESIKSRIKQPDSILKKIEKLGLPMAMESVENNIFDVAGVRVICSFVDDIYVIERLFLAQEDIELINRKDYIESPKPSGYRSLHLVIRTPIYTESGKKNMFVEVQVRTIAMDFWASLEHKLRYKKNINPDLMEELSEELQFCAEESARMDLRMQAVRKKLDNAALLE